MLQNPCFQVTICARGMCPFTVLPLVRVLLLSAVPLHRHVLLLLSLLLLLLREASPGRRLLEHPTGGLGR